MYSQVTDRENRSWKTIFDVLYSKQAFLNNENIGFKNPQNWHFFSKGLVLHFGQEVEEKLFADVLDKKKAFKDYKSNCLQKRKIKIFLQRG